MITTVEIVFFYSLFYLTDIPSCLPVSTFFLKLIILIPMIGLPLLHNWMQDRDQNYKSVKEHLFIYGFQKRTVKSFIKSRCQSDVAKAAAYELGMSQQCKEYFKIKGYKSYHPAPDVIFKDPSLFFTKKLG